MAQSPKGGLYGPPSKGHLGDCAIYFFETTVHAYYLQELSEVWTPFLLCSGLLTTNVAALIYFHFVTTWCVETKSLEMKWSLWARHFVEMYGGTLDKLLACTA